MQHSVGVTVNAENAENSCCGFGSRHRRIGNFPGGKSPNGKVQAVPSVLFCDGFWGGCSLPLSLVLGMLVYFWEVMLADTVCHLVGALGN